MTSKQVLTGYPSIDKPWLKYYSEEAINTPLPECTIYEYLWENNKDHLDDIALNYFGHKISYRELFSNIDRVGAAFSALGVKSGDVVTICSVATPEIIYCIYGLNKIGAINNIVEPRTNVERIIQRVQDANSKYIVLLDALYGKLRASLPSIQYKYTVIVPVSNAMPKFTKKMYALFHAPKDRISYSDRMLNWKSFLDCKKAESAPIHKNDSPAAIIYTGGTTGTAKGAVLSNDSMNAVAHQYKYGFEHQYGEVFLNIMPPFIAYGLVCGLHMPLSLGLTVAIIPVFSVAKFDSYLIRHKPQYILGVPAHFEVLMLSKKLKHMDLSFIKYVGVGGDHLNIELEKKINKFFCDHKSKSFAAKGYGMTEMSSAACTCSDKCNALGSVGAPFANTIIAVFETGTENELPYGEQGEIYISGPGMMLGYFNNPEETNRTIYTHKDGTKWIHTQDIGYMNEDGMVFIVDRMKRMIVVEGHNVWPSMIEQTIVSHPNVHECAVVGVADPTMQSSQTPIAFIALKEHTGKSEAEIKDEIISLCYEKLPERDMAREYVFVAKIPLTSVGKVDFRALEKLAEEMRSNGDM